MVYGFSMVFRWFSHGFLPLRCSHCGLQALEQGVYVDLQDSSLLDEGPARTEAIGTGVLVYREGLIYG